MMSSDAKGTLKEFLELLEHWAQHKQQDAVLHIKVAVVDTYGNHIDMLEQYVTARSAEADADQDTGRKWGDVLADHITGRTEMNVGHESAIAEEANNLPVEQRDIG